MILTRGEIEAVAANAGFQGEDLEKATAIAFAESGGVPDRYNPETAAGTPDGLGSVGLWQIYRRDHPEFAAWNLTDPQVNACAASMVWRRAGNLFTPWSTWKTGAYRKFLLPAAPAPENPAANPGDTADPPAAIESAQEDAIL
jgi:hypothetical protein